MTWIKLDDGFPSNPKIVNLSDHSFRLYISGLCYSGKYLTDGYIPAAIVNQYGDPSELLERGLWVEVEDGVQVINYTEYQTPKSEVEKKKEQNRDRASRYRSRVTNAQITLPDNRIQITDNRIQTKEIELSFESFWSVYPRKTAKGAARTAWARALKAGNIAEELIAAAERYAKDKNREDAFTAHASTWLNQERWLDSSLPERPGDPRKPDPVFTPTPPKYVAENRPEAVKMPDHIRQLINVSRSEIITDPVS